MLLAEVQVHLAQVALVQERAPLPLVENKVRILPCLLVCRRDRGAQAPSKVASDSFIVPKCLLVYTYLPADTAVIPAAVRQTGERSIIGRGKMFHSAESPLLVKYPLLFYHGNEAAGRGFSREISVRGILAPEGIYRVY